MKGGGERGGGHARMLKANVGPHHSVERFVESALIRSRKTIHSLTLLYTVFSLPGILSLFV